MIHHCDVAVVGSGFAGSLTAMIARRLGLTVWLVERGRHPRFVIGESSTPLADQLWSELVQRYDLPALAPFSKHGSWRRAHPEIACGLKRGFSFCQQRWNEPFLAGPDRARLMLVAASTNDEEADTHWYRPDFDTFLVGEARRLGAGYLEETVLDRVTFEAGGARLAGQQHGRELTVKARLVVDATGPRGFLFRSLGLAERALPNLPQTQALYTHFADVDRFEAQLDTRGAEAPPFPPDDAALHHVFPGGWVWVLRFSNGLTSAGVAARDSVAAGLGLAEGAIGWDRLLDRLPSLGAQFRAARATNPFVHAPRLPFWCGPAAGPNWIQLPYATGFLDPLLSTGFPLSLLGIGRLATVLEGGLDPANLAQGLAACERDAEADFLAAERLVAALYAAMGDPEAFNALLLLYFAAASFSEVSRRAGRRNGGFLLHDHPTFGPASARCCAQGFAAARAKGGFAPEERERWLAGLRTAIEPVNLMRLGDSDRRNWYPIRSEDFLAAAGKLAAAGELSLT